MTITLDQHAKAIRSLGKQTVENVIEIGYRLIECRAVLKEDGKWRAWLKDEFGWSKSSAQNFINVYDMTKSEGTNFGHSDLPVSALYLLAAPTTSKEARDEVIARVKRGEKVKHEDVAAVTRKTKKPKEYTGLKAEIIEAVKDAGDKGLTTDQLKTTLTKHHPQTVNSATNALAQADVLHDSGERRETSSGGGRPAIVYVYNPLPAPKKKKPSSAKVVDFGERKLVGMIEDESIVEAIKAWGASKSKKQRVEKAYRLVVPLIGESRGGILALANEQDRVATAEGRAFEFKL